MFFQFFWMDEKQPYETESECESYNVYMGITERHTKRNKWRIKKKEKSSRIPLGWNAHPRAGLKSV